GIAARRIAADHESAASLGAPAAAEALQMAGVDPLAVDLVICATATPDRVFPSTASLIQHAIGARRAAAFDVVAACSGFVYAYATAAQFIQSGAYRTVVVVGSEIYSRILDWTDRSTCVLFGDGAGAVVLQASPDGAGLLSFTLGSDGAGADLLYVPSTTGAADSRALNGAPTLKMNGPEVYRFAVSAMTDSIRDVTTRCGLAPADVDLVIAHQANERILRAAAKQLGLPPERFYQNLERYGNTSAASIPIAITEAVEEGRLRDGDRVVLVGFGGGLSWGAALLEWGVRPIGAPARRAAAIVPA
ncbi:MAG: ketoacyl-ACP synthase III, partial [Dehalococcoidia bacterium]|nr:ketoacyl-ACP synthase III [Dehalococcoidia bacterium]